MCTGLAHLPCDNNFSYINLNYNKALCFGQDEEEYVSKYVS